MRLHCVEALWHSDHVPDGFDLGPGLDHRRREQSLFDADEPYVCGRSSLPARDASGLPTVQRREMFQLLLSSDPQWKLGRVWRHDSASAV